MDLNRLQKQAAIARAARLQQNTHKAKLPTRPHGVASSYDADTSMDIIRLSDGSTSYALPDTSGVRSPGDQLVVRTGGGTTHIDAMNSKRTLPIPKERKLLSKPELHTFKVLFSVIENDIQKFYIGGDRAEPLLIFEIDTTIYEGYFRKVPAFVEEQQLDYTIVDNFYITVNNQFIIDPATNDYAVLENYINGYISNSGNGLNDWVAGIYYAKEDNNRFSEGDDIFYLSVITPKQDNPASLDIQTFTDYETTGVGLASYRGAGLWISSIGRDHRPLTKLLDVSFWYWENEQYESIVQPSSQPTSGIRAPMPEEWAFNTGEQTPPFSAATNYIYDDSDHEGIRQLQDTCNISAEEIFTFASGGNHIPPPSSYYEGEFSGFSGAWAISVLLGEINPYSWDKYSTGTYAEHFKSGGLGVASGFSAWGIGRFQAGHYQLDSTRAFIMINGTEVTKVDYTSVYSEGNFSAYRQKNMPLRSSPNFSWQRVPFIHECSGKNYILPDVYLEDAKSKSSKDSLSISVNSTVTNPAENYRLKANYAETIAASTKTESCLFYRVNIDSTSPYTQRWENSDETQSKQFFIYDKSQNAEYPVVLPNGETSIEFEHRLDTFIKNNDNQYKRVYFQRMPNDLLGQGSIKLNPKVQQFTKQLNGELTIEEGTSKPVNVFSLNIDLSSLYYIHNISYF